MTQHSHLPLPDGVELVSFVAPEMNGRVFELRWYEPMWGDAHLYVQDTLLDEDIQSGSREAVDQTVRSLLERYEQFQGVQFMVTRGTVAESTRYSAEEGWRRI